MGKFVNDHLPRLTSCSSGAAISTKHTLALVNTGSARARDLLALAAAVRERVHTAFGIDLQIEPTVVP